MHEQLEKADALLQLLMQQEKAPSDAFVGLLHADARYARLAYRASGSTAVLAELQKEATLALVRRLVWRAPEAFDAGVRLIGNPGAGTSDRSLIFVFHFQDGMIIEVQQQFGATVAAPGTPLRLTPALRALIDQALETQHPMLLAYTDPDGQAWLSFRGSTQAYGDTQLALWVRNPSGAFIQAIAQNPHIALMYRNEESRATYQFHGRARVTTDEAERRKIYDQSPKVERDHDFAMMGAAVLIELTRIEGYSGLGPGGQMDRILMRAESV